VRAVKGKPPTRGKLYVSKGWLRTESRLPGRMIVLIVDRGSSQAWLVMAPMPLFLLNDLKETLVATEIGDRRPTKKYELTSSGGPLTTRLGARRRTRRTSLTPDAST
jgi:hypothetical protein